MHPEIPSDPQRSFITIDSRQVAFTDEGEGQLIVAIPGLPGSARDFRWLAPTLTEQFRLIRFEPPGFGASHRTNYRAQTIEERAAELVAFLERFDMPVVLLTHSAGATVGAYVAVHCRERVSRCVFIAPPGEQPHFPQRLYRTVRFSLHRSLSRTALSPVLKRFYKLAGFPAYLTDDERIFATLDAAAMDFEAYGNNVALMEQPTLVAWAADDQLIPNAFTESMISRLKDGTKLRFDAGGHAVQKAIAMELGSAITEFLSS